jgi:hypothetical protein
VINLVKRLELGGQAYALVADEVRLSLNGVGRGQFHVRAEEPIEAGVLARYTLALDGRAYPVLLGAVTEVSQRGEGLWRVGVRELAAALERPAHLALRHVTPAQVLAALEDATGLRFLLPSAGAYLVERQPYFYARGDGRAALAQMGAVWQVPMAVWAQLPDGRVYWGDWAASPFNGGPLSIPAGLVVERDELGGSLELPAVPALRPGMVVELAGEDLRFLVQSVSFREDRTRLEWEPLPGAGP